MEQTLAIGRDDSYSSWKTNPIKQLAVFHGLMAYLKEQFAFYGKPDIVLCHGSSGIFACVPLLQFLAEHGVALFHLRKEGENSHGQEFEGPRMERNPVKGPFVAWMIDDLVASGKTVRYVQKRLNAYPVRLDRVITYSDARPSQVEDVRIDGLNFVDGYYK